MTLTDFTTTLQVDQTPIQAFDAINNVRGWWSEEITGPTDQLNKEFNYRYKDVHKCRIKVDELIPGKKVAWHVLDNYFSFTKDKTEWKGTKIIFDISEKDDRTQIRFTHEGLVPEYECFDICENAWTQYIQKSLKDLITTGKGHPNSNVSDYQKIITVNKPVSEVYDAITSHIADWWSNNLTGTSTNAGDSFTIAFGKTRKTFEVKDVIPNEFVVWNCVKAHIDADSLKNKAEWVGTNLLWGFRTEGNNTTLTFTHEGLNKNLECYEICEAGWDQFLGSLETYLKTGKGLPYLK